MIRFGAAGPQVSFAAKEGEPPAAPMTRLERETPVARRPEAQRRPARTAKPEAAARRPKPSRPAISWKRHTIGIAVLALLVAGGLYALTLRRNRQNAAERALLLARTDSLLSRIRAAPNADSSLATALQAARTETEGLRAQVAGAEAGRGDSLGDALAAALLRYAGVVRAAELDIRAIEAAGAGATGMVVSGFADGHWLTGTGVAVRVRGDTGWIATSRDLVADSAGRPATRIGIFFNGSAQQVRAELLAGTTDSAGLALLRIRIRGGMPAVRLREGAPRVGDPVALLGFPDGFGAQGNWRRNGVRAARVAGSIRRIGPERIELDGYGGSAAGGSPVFAADGAVATGWSHAHGRTGLKVVPCSWQATGVARYRVGGAGR